MSRSNKREKAGPESGQSTVEFTLTMVLVVAFVLFFFQLSMLMAVGNYVQYATFMAARAYLSSGPDEDDQMERARNVIKSMLKQQQSSSTDRFPMIVKGTASGDDVTGVSFNASQYNPTDQNYSWLLGVRYTFQGRVFLIPLSGGIPSQSSSQTSVPLISETFLGREATQQECVSEMSSNRGGGIFDNGC